MESMTIRPGSAIRDHRSGTPIRYDNHGGGSGHPASHDNETPIDLRGPEPCFARHGSPRRASHGHHADTKEGRPVVDRPKPLF